MLKTILLSSKDVEQLKQRARKLKKAKNLTHTQALDYVARDFSFQNWHHVCTCAEVFKPTELAFKSGCIIAMDIKEGMDFEMDNVIEDNNALYFCRNDLIGYFTDSSDKPTQDEIEAIDDESHQNYLFFRFLDTSSIQDISSLLNRINKYSMWLPRFIWLHGKFYDQYEGIDVHTSTHNEDIKWYQVQAEVDETKGKVGWDLHYQIEHSEVYLSPHVRLAGNKAAMIATKELAQSYANRCAPIFKKRGHVVFFEVVEWEVPTSSNSKRGLSLLATIQEHSQIIQARLDQDVMAPNKKPLI